VNLSNFKSFALFLGALYMFAVCTLEVIITVMTYVTMTLQMHN